MIAMPRLQDALLYASMALFAAALVLLVLSVRTYVVLDIRAVRADLAGRRRDKKAHARSARVPALISQDDIVTQVLAKREGEEEPSSCAREKGESHEQTE